MTKTEAIEMLNKWGVLLPSETSEALEMAIESLSADAEDRYYIRIYADDEPSVKAEKLYQICDETQNREVAEWLKEYFPSAEAKTKCIAQINIDADEVVKRIKDEYEIADRPQGEWLVYEGRWKDLDYYPPKCKCNQCGYEEELYILNAKPTNYCPNCGAKMEVKK